MCKTSQDEALSLIFPRYSYFQFSKAGCFPAKPLNCSYHIIYVQMKGAVDFV